MKMYIPHLGDDLLLTADWAFKLYTESRNLALIDHFQLPRAWDLQEAGKDASAVFEANPAYSSTDAYRFYNSAYIKPAIIPAGTVLRIKRIFIRQGMPMYDSVTFACKLPNPKGKASAVRFWAKLDDVNKIEFEQVQPELPLVK